MATPAKASPKAEAILGKLRMAAQEKAAFNDEEITIHVDVKGGRQEYKIRLRELSYVEQTRLLTRNMDKMQGDASDARVAEERMLYARDRAAMSITHVDGIPVRELAMGLEGISEDSDNTTILAALDEQVYEHILTPQNVAMLSRHIDRNQTKAQEAMAEISKKKD